MRHACLGIAFAVTACGAVSPLVDDPRLDCGEPPAGECVSVADAALDELGVVAADVSVVRVLEHDCQQLAAQLFRGAEFGGAGACWTVAIEHGAVLDQVIVYRGGAFEPLRVTPWER